MRKKLKRRNNLRLKYRFDNPLWVMLSKGMQEIREDIRMSKNATRMEPVWEEESNIGWTSKIRYEKKVDGRIKESKLSQWSLVNPFEEEDSGQD